MSIEVDIRKKLFSFTLHICFTAENERLGLLGASGCGKSMTLKCIAGINTPDEGRIVINGRVVYDSRRRINLPPRERKIGYLFQQYALFPHMTVRQNLGIVLKNRGAGEKKKLIAETLSKFALEDLADRKPAQLSGGQQQRAAIARMMVLSPEIIMLDEPFSALDSYLRDSVEKELMEILSGFQGSILFVSHNRDEVYRICRKMIVLDKGRMTRSGQRDEIFRDPRTVAAARLTGCKNIAPADRAGDRRLFVPRWNLTLTTALPIPGDISHVGIRAHHIRPPYPGETENCFTFSVAAMDARPFSLSEYINREGGTPLVRIIEDDQGVPFHQVSGEEGEKQLCLPPEQLLLLRDG
jgi:molybdate transport system ATP-binding protein